jgi:hypothetical protein
MHRTGYIPDLQIVHAKARAGALAAGARSTLAVLVYVTPDGAYSRAVPLAISVPAQGTPEYAAIQAEVIRMRARSVTVSAGLEEERRIARVRMPRPNDPCWCGSGKKYKKCHRV